jgi:phosphatidylglycerophosphatase A
MQASKDPEPDRSGSRTGLSLVTVLIATGFYSGYVSWASGTFGTIVGAAIYYVLPGSEQPLILGGMIVLGFAVGVAVSGRVAAVEGGRLTRTAEAAKATFQPGVHSMPDPSIVVIDEIVGMWITMLGLPKSFPVMMFGFLAFRICDILKPFPARQVEIVPDGWGIMLDDVIAGIYALAATHVAVYLLGLTRSGFLV